MVHQDQESAVGNNWRTWIPPGIHTLPKHGTLNVHDSLPPEYAGFSPPIRALVNSESEVGVTAHLMDEVLDAGDIARQEAVGPGRRRRSDRHRAPNTTTSFVYRVRRSTPSTRRRSPSSKPRSSSSVAPLPSA